jgi:RNA polymerase sigma-70 factor (ECF subfamily)
LTIALVATQSVEEPAFLERLWPLLPSGQRLAYGLLQNAHDAEDALQDATVNAWRARARLREGAELRPWFLTIVANECRQRLRSRWWSVAKVAELVAVRTHANNQEAVLDLRAALGRIPNDMRLALVLRYYLDLGFEEMAIVLNCSPKAAKSRTFRALQKLRIQIPKELAD